MVSSHLSEGFLLVCCCHGIIVRADQMERRKTNESIKKSDFSIDISQAVVVQPT